MGAKLNPEQLESAIALQKQGLTQVAIAAEVGIDRKTVCRALSRYNKRVMERLMARGEEEKAKQFQKLAYLYVESVAAWEKSKRSAKVTKVIECDDASGNRTETTTKTTAGDATYLSQARGALTDQRAILGLDAPKKTDNMNRGDAGSNPPPPFGLEHLSQDAFTRIMAIIEQDQSRAGAQVPQARG